MKLNFSQHGIIHALKTARWSTTAVNLWLKIVNSEREVSTCEDENKCYRYDEIREAYRAKSSNHNTI